MTIQMETIMKINNLKIIIIFKKY